MASDGLVVMGAEAITRTGQAWQARAVLAGYVGEGYVQALPDVGARRSGDGGAELQYDVYFETPGAYTVWAYGAAADAGGDSINVGLDGAPVVEALTGFRYRAWGWSAAEHGSAGATGTTTATLTIPAPGFYTVNVWAREDGVRLDRLLLALDGQYAPTGSGPAESARLVAGEALAAGPPSAASSRLAANAEAAARQVRDQARAELLALLLSNPGILLLGPLALVAPQVYGKRRRRKAQGQRHWCCCSRCCCWAWRWRMGRDRRRPRRHCRCPRRHYRQAGRRRASATPTTAPTD